MSDLFDGEGDLDEGEDWGLKAFNRLLALFAIESLSTPPSEQTDSESFSLTLFFSFLM